MTDENEKDKTHEDEDKDKDGSESVPSTPAPLGDIPDPGKSVPSTVPVKHEDEGKDDHKD